MHADPHRRAPVYDRIGAGYATRRTTDPRWMAVLEQELGDATRVVNVGAGTGNYESGERDVVAVEPSWTMIGQRAAGSAPVVQGIAERLPFRDDAFDAATAVLTIHHWTDLEAGLRELRRVARRQVVLTFDPAALNHFWLHRDYLPRVRDIDADRLPDAPRIGRTLGELRTRPCRCPATCATGC